MDPTTPDGLQQLPQISASPLVLFYGHDASLMRTRRWIVERVGCCCELAMNATAYRECFQNVQPRLIIFCQTLTEQECAEASRFAGEQSPGSRFLVMFNRPQTCAPAQAHVRLDARMGPASFSQAVVALL